MERVHMDVECCVICGSDEVDNVLRARVVEKVSPEVPDLLRWGVCSDVACRQRLVALVALGPPKDGTAASA